MSSQKHKTIIVLVFLTSSFYLPAVYSAIPGGSLDPIEVPKYETPLIIPPVMGPKSKGNQNNLKGNSPTIYEIAVRQFQQSILPPPFKATTVWSYGQFTDPMRGPKANTSYNYPAFTIEARSNKTTRIRWVNQLIDEKNNFLPHLLPVDQTLHWANPPGDCFDPPKRPDCNGKSQAFYLGPVPIVTHVHGSHVNAVSDGFPEAWYLPNAKNIPKSYFKQGSHYGSAIPAPPGSAWFEYDNSQRAATLWYHDHTLGITRLNVYAGPAGFYLLRDANDTGLINNPLGLPAPAPQLGEDPNGDSAVRAKIREIPIAIQDRSFNDDGSLFYPNNRAFFEGLVPADLQIPFIPDLANSRISDVSPIWNPEFFGNMMVTNGKTWPKLDVVDHRYRLRLLNGSNSRTLVLEFRKDSINGDPIEFNQIGSEGGFLPQTVALTKVVIAPAERADILIRFPTTNSGHVYLVNLGPDSPFSGEVPDNFQSDPDSTGQVMRFNVTHTNVPDPSSNISTIDTKLAAIWQTEGHAAQLAPQPAKIRNLTLNELESAVICAQQLGNGTIVQVPGEPPACSAGSSPFGPTQAKLGIFDPQFATGIFDGINGGTFIPLSWGAPITEKPKLNDTEVWRIINNTADTHPIHVHMVQFAVIGRIDVNENFIPPFSNETGWKDTVRANPGEITLVKAKFDKPGLFVWHCHILEHEDNEMMRPYEVINQ